MIRITKLVALLSISMMTVNCSCSRSLDEKGGDSKKDDNLVENTFSESKEAFSNPMKGYITKNPRNPYTTLTRMDIRWRDIENSASDGVDKIKKYCDVNFIPFERRGIKIIPRIIGCWPQAEYAEGRVKSAYGRWCDVYWPSDLEMGNMSVADYSKEQFKTRTAALIGKLGEAWDNDPRIAFIHMGIVGYWGEQNSPFVSDVPGLEKVMGDACVAAFKNTCVAKRLHSTFKDYEFGIYYDSFGHADTDDWKYMIKLGDYWKRQAITGEVAYDWGNYKEQPGASPTESLSKPKHLNFLTALVRKTHTTALSWISEYDTNVPAAVAGAKEFQKALGYRFYIPNVKFTPEINEENPELTASLTIVNVGSAPLYAKYALKIHLLSTEDRAVVWSGSFDGADSRRWMSGDNWSDEENRYLEAAPKNKIEGKWTIPAALTGKEYFLAVSLDDMTTGKPAVRFAQDNYFAGGYTVLGRVGAGIRPSTTSAANEKFDVISSERLD